MWEDGKCYQLVNFTFRPDSRIKAIAFDIAKCLYPVCKAITPYRQRIQSIVIAFPRSRYKKRTKEVRTEYKMRSCKKYETQFQHLHSKGSVIDKSLTCLTWKCSLVRRHRSLLVKQNCAFLDALFSSWSFLCCSAINILLTLPIPTSNLMNSSILAFDTKNIAKLTCDIMPR